MLSRYKGYVRLRMGAPVSIFSRFGIRICFGFRDSRFEFVRATAQIATRRSNDPFWTGSNDSGRFAVTPRQFSEHYRPISPDIDTQTLEFTNVFGISYPTPIPEFTTRFARGTEIRRRGSRESEIGINLVCSTLTSLIANLRFARTAYLGRKRRGIPPTSANSCPPPYTPMAEI